MAKVVDHDAGRTLEDTEEIRAFLARHGIWYRRHEPAAAIPEDASDEEVLAALEEPIAALREEGGYTTADVVRLRPDAPDLDSILAKFRAEHWHDEDEVRFVVAGRGRFFVHPAEGGVFSIEVEAGDLINVPRGVRHWFDLCEDRAIRAVRLFQDPAGWTPHYTHSGVEARYR